MKAAERFFHITNIAWYLIAIVCCLWGICRIASHLINPESSLATFLVLFTCFLFFPVTATLGPLVILIIFGDWLPLVILWGGAFALMYIRGALVTAEEKYDERQR